MSLVLRHAIIEDVLHEWSERLGQARLPYAGHAYRVFNIARTLVGSDAHDDALALASIFHDLGIWSDGTFDYLPPSLARAESYRRERAPALRAELIANVIENHHALRKVRAGADARLVEAFRQADQVDVSHGLLRAGLTRAELASLVRAFPYAGFHGVLLRTALAWTLRHPLRPLPMLRLSSSQAGKTR